MHPINRRNALQACAGLALGTLAGRAPAQEKFPHKPISLIVPQPAGGDADTVCRLLQPRMQQALGQPVVIDNRGGAGGNIGTALGAKAAPDGYTVTFVNQGTMALNPALYAHPGYSPDMLTPVTWLTSIDLVIAAHPSVPASNLQELIALARKEPGRYSYATAGNGSANHLAGEMLKAMAGIDLMHVPYKGGGPSIIALLGGEVSLALAFPLATLAHIRAGKLKALAVTGSRRSRALPEVPTVAESGVPGYAFSSWMGLAAPKGTPEPAITRIHGAARLALQDKSVAERLSDGMTEPVGAGPREFGELIARERQRWPALIRQFAMRVD